MTAFRLLVALLLLVVSTEAKKVARVKAGRKYNEHEPVHIVVNKVGYVIQILAVHFLRNFTWSFCPVFCATCDCGRYPASLPAIYCSFTFSNTLILSPTSYIVRSTIPQRRIVIIRFRFAVLMRRKKKRFSKLRRKKSTCQE